MSKSTPAPPPAPGSLNLAMSLAAEEFGLRVPDLLALAARRKLGADRTVVAAELPAAHGVGAGDCRGKRVVQRVRHCPAGNPKGFASALDPVKAQELAACVVSAGLLGISIEEWTRRAVLDLLIADDPQLQLLALMPASSALN